MQTREKNNTVFSDRETSLSDENMHNGYGEIDTFRETLFKDCRKKRFSAKQVIFRECDSVDKVFVILSGMVKLLSYLPNGRARIVRLHGQNHWLGLEGLVRQPYEHTAIAVDDVEVAYVPMNKLHLLERDHPQQYCQILKQGYSYLADADRWIAHFSTGGIKPRVARMVEFLSILEYGKSSNKVELLTVFEMADMLGVTPESVSRILAEFKRKDILHKLDGVSDETYVINPRKLQQVAVQ